MTDSRRRYALAFAATVVVAVSRVMALARGPWDWDEMLFLLGLRDYDVALHHPHPPGFPLFMLAARAFIAAGFEPFHALQAVNVIAAVIIVPVFLLLCRELRLPFHVSLGASLLFAFFPNVWFFGGTGFSDVPAIVLAIAACALLLRGRESSSALIAGAFVLALAAGIRPQNLLVGALPAMIGAWAQVRRRRFAVVAVAAVVGLCLVAASYWGAVVATGNWQRYRDTVLAHQRYLAEVDSFMSDQRPSLLQISDDFFVRPFRLPVVNIVLSFLALVSGVRAFLRRDRGLLLAIGMFGPFWLLAWLTLDFHSAGRFSIGYMPLLAILAADGVATMARRHEETVTIAACSLLATVMASWAWPGVLRARSQWSPPLQAIAHVQRAVSPGTIIYVPKRLRPYSEYYLMNHKLVHLEEGEAPAQTGGFYLREGRSDAPGAVIFEWPEQPLWNIARRRYFAVAVVPLR